MRSHLFSKALVFFPIIMLFGCGTRPQPSQPPDFSVISSPRVPVLAQITSTPTATPTPIPTPVPTEPPATPTEAKQDEGPTLFQMSPVTPIPPTNTSTPSPTTEPTPTPIPATPTPPPPTRRPVRPLDPPRQGGSWDLEDGFMDWRNPFGDDCSGAKVAIGWQAFTSRGQYGSSCFVQNEYAPNVFSGRYSQEITFDFVDSHAGLYRTFDSQSNHRYQVLARIRHVGTTPPMQFHFGFDPTGNSNWQADTIQWTAWSEFIIDQWMTHEQIFTATGPKTTVYIKGFHQIASQGGATYIDGVEIIDLGEP